MLLKTYFAHHFGGYDVINECALFMHLVKLTKFTLGTPITRKVITGCTQPCTKLNPINSASFKLWYLIITQLVLEILQNKTVSLSNNHPVHATFSQNPFLPLFFKLLAFPQFLRYNGEIDMIYHAWMEYDSLKISCRWDERFGF